MNWFRNAIVSVVLAVVMIMPAWASASESVLFTLAVKSTGQTHDVTRSIAGEIGLTTLRTKSTSFEDRYYEFTGVLLRDLIQHFDIPIQDLVANAHDNYEMTIPAQDYGTYPILICFDRDGKPLTRRQKGPTMILYPISLHPHLADSIFEAREVWHLRSLTAAHM